MARASRSYRRKSLLLQRRILATVLEHVDEQNQQEGAGSLSQQQVVQVGTVEFPIANDQSQSQGNLDASGPLQRSAEKCPSTHNPQDRCCDCPYCRHPSNWAKGTGAQRDGHRQVENQPCPIHGNRRGHRKTVSSAGQHALLVQLQSNPEPVYLDPSKMKIGVKAEHRLSTALDITPNSTSYPSTRSMMRERNAAAANDVKDVTLKLGNLFSLPHKNGNEDHFFPRKPDAGKPFVFGMEEGRRRVAPGIAQRVACQPEEQRRPINKQE